MGDSVQQAVLIKYILLHHSIQSKVFLFKKEKLRVSLCISIKKRPFSKRLGFFLIWRQRWDIQPNVDVRSVSLRRHQPSAGCALLLCADMRRLVGSSFRQGKPVCNLFFMCHNITDKQKIVIVLTYLLTYLLMTGRLNLQIKAFEVNPISILFSPELVFFLKNVRILPPRFHSLV